MRPFLSLVAIAVVQLAVLAQPTDRVHEFAKGGLKLEGRIADGDPRVKIELEANRSAEMPAKRFLVKLPGGKKYRITMRSTELDSFLMVQDKDGKQLDYDDDSGGGNDSALTLDIEKTAVFRVFAASVDKTGAFTVEIREQAP
jgi:hypothetical protein